MVAPQTVDQHHLPVQPRLRQLKKKAFSTKIRRASSSLSFSFKHPIADGGAAVGMFLAAPISSLMTVQRLVQWSGCSHATVDGQVASVIQWQSVNEILESNRNE